MFLFPGQLVKFKTKLKTNRVNVKSINRLVHFTTQDVYFYLYFQNVYRWFSICSRVNLGLIIPNK